MDAASGRRAAAPRSLRSTLATLAALCLVVTTVHALGFAAPARAAGIGFGKSVLSGATKTRPTALQFGPDGRLYILHQDGTINIDDVVRNGPNDYAVAATETLLSIKNIDNHNDEGALDNTFVANSCTSPCRLATGMVVTGTAAQPVIYVSSSDPRYGGATRGDLNLDTNSGMISRLTWDAPTSSWVKKDLVRGLPRSEENHAVNGLALDQATNTLYLAAGGNTNEGAPSNVFAYLPEYALSAAILSIDLDAIGDTTYDIPTLNDPSRADDPNSPGSDLGDPFGGNNGANQAMIVVGGPVQVYAPGFRNPYDLLFATVGAHAGKMYVTDNGYNAGEGGKPIGEGTPNCTNGANDTSKVTGYDSLHYVPGPGYYGGHPNPTRGNGANTFAGQSPVPASAVDPIECDFQTSLGADPTPERSSIGWDVSSTNGIAEYTASNFGGAMTGDLITAEWDGYVDRFQLNAAGTAVASQSTLFSAVSTHPLAIAASGDGDPFPGTIWLADHPTGTIYVFEPNDYDGASSTCTGADDPNLDEDGDGYTNADEIDNNTDPCSAADVPRDWDGDKVSNLNDPDDDNDGIPDTSDAWAIDPANGTTTVLPVNHPFDTSDPGGGLVDLGFTGLMTNGSANYESLYDPTKLTAGGAGGVLTVDQVGPGTAAGAANTQTYAFQYGFSLPSAHGAVFTPHTRVLSPFAGVTRTGTQSIGLQFGTGDQDNYVSLVTSTAGGGSIRLAKEVAGAIVASRSVHVVLPSTGSVDLFLAVNPVTHQVQPSYRLSNGTTTNLGAPIAVPTAWFSRAALAAGVIATSGGAPAFPANWDMFEIALPQYRPDSQGKLSGAASYVGDNVYNATGSGQTVSVSSAAGATKTFVVNVQNDGAVSDSYLLKGPGSSTGFTVKYFTGTTDITAAVVAGTYSLGPVAPGAASSIQQRVTVAPGVGAGSAKSGLVTATSTHASAVDAIKTVVTVR